VQAQVTQNALLTPSATATLSPTFTPQPLAVMTLPAGTSGLSATLPISTTTSAGTAATLPVSIADNAIWVKDVTVPDGTIYYKNEGFTKTWKVKNTGSTTWDESYSLVNIDDSGFTTNPVVPLTQSVAPGATVDLSIAMRAPKSLGFHFSRWFLINSSGQKFGQELYVYIKVGTFDDKTPTPSG